MDPVPQLYTDGASAWVRYLDEGQKSSDLAESIRKCNEALGKAPKDHPQRNEILLVLIFALLEQNLDQPSLEKIEKHFNELAKWSEMETGRKVDARAIAARLASRYHELYNQSEKPSDSDFQRCLSGYTRVRDYSDKLEDWMDANLKMAALHHSFQLVRKSVRDSHG